MWIELEGVCGLKRCWHLMVRKEGGWERVEEMGRHGGRSYGGFKEGVVWRWSNWFDDNLRRVVGDGVSTYFWTDPWLGGISMCVTYMRLYELSENRLIYVAGMFSLC